MRGVRQEIIVDKIAADTRIPHARNKDIDKDINIYQMLVVVLCH